MRSQHFSHTASDGAALEVYCWLPDDAATRAIQIIHGMAEHAGRYARFAQALTDAGYAIFAQNLRGHGANAALPGHYADNNGWQRVVADVHEIHDHIRAQFPRLPQALFGHSMGSFISQACAAQFGKELDAVVLCATDKPPKPLLYGGLLAAWFERWRRGPRESSALLQKLSFGNFNQPFESKSEPARTGFEWLSSDATEVDKYMHDPLCGFACSTETWCQLLRAITQVQSRSSIQDIPAGLPVLLIAGSDDPVARFGKGPSALAAHYRRAGLSKVSTQFYADCRHELLNETAREKVTHDVLNWLNQHCATDFRR